MSYEPNPVCTGCFREIIDYEPGVSSVWISRTEVYHPHCAPGLKEIDLMKALIKSLEESA